MNDAGGWGEERGMLPGKMMGRLSKDAALLTWRRNEEATSHSPQRTEPPEATETSKRFPPEPVERERPSPPDQYIDLVQPGRQLTAMSWFHPGEGT